jgi:hypothetical protein
MFFKFFNSEFCGFEVLGLLIVGFLVLISGGLSHASGGAEPLQSRVPSEASPVANLGRGLRIVSASAAWPLGHTHLTSLFSDRCFHQPIWAHID